MFAKRRQTRDRAISNRTILLYVYTFVEITYCGGAYAMSDNASSVAGHRIERARTCWSPAVCCKYYYYFQPTDCFSFGTSCYEILDSWMVLYNVLYCASTTSMCTHNTWLLVRIYYRYAGLVLEYEILVWCRRTLINRSWMWYKYTILYKYYENCVLTHRKCNRRYANISCTFKDPVGK